MPNFDPKFPCLAIRRGSPRWVCPPKYRKAGYSVASVNLRGLEGDALSNELIRLTGEMLEWWNGSGHPRDTWGWLLNEYLTGPHTPLDKVALKTREGYAAYAADAAAYAAYAAARLRQRDTILRLISEA